MKFDFPNEIEVYKKIHTRKRRWQKIVAAISCVVVFCTTYALILPAITMEKKPTCGFKQEHIHDESCYSEIITLSGYDCSLKVHVHNSSCYGEDGKTHCGYADFVIHHHDKNCYDKDGNLICTLQEVAEHKHTLECYQETVAYNCGLEEGEGHHHSEACKEVHKELICGQKEVIFHEHTSECFTNGDMEHGSLICGKTQVLKHQHDESCFSKSSVKKALTCTIPEHEHVDACYDTDEEQSLEYSCGMGEHQHRDICYNEAHELICTIPQHQHTLGCRADYDPKADLESASNWEATLPDEEKITGNWAEDILLVAESQLGYKESKHNYIIDEKGDVKGYTRYGEWYGDPYGDWCAIYVSFCLHYAGIPKEIVPYEASCPRWIDALEKQGLYNDADTYVPVPGDIIFFDLNNEGFAGHVGIVKEIIPATETAPAKIRTIEGNSSDCVKYVTYALDDQAILGYCSLPENTYGDLVYTELQAQIYTDSSYSKLLDDDTEIQVSGELPKGAEVRAYPVTIEADEINVLYAYDLAVYLPDGSLYEPLQWKPLSVHIIFPELTQEELKVPNYEVYYVPEKGEPEKVDSSTEEESISFIADHFSVYAVVSPEGTQVSSATELKDAIKRGNNQSIYLSSNFTVSGTITIPENANITLNLNGKTLTQSGTAPLFSIGDKASLTIVDSVPVEEAVRTVSGNMYGNTAALEGSTLTYYVTKTDIVSSATGATVETLERHIATGKGQIIANGQTTFSVKGGTLNIKSGMIRSGTGRAIDITSGNVNLDGGYICGFNLSGSSDFGGAIRATGGKVNINGAVVAANSAANGGAIYASGATVNISEGAISGNIANRTEKSWESSSYRNGGGGIYGEANASITMSGGYLTNNKMIATGYFDGGGGVLLSGTSTFQLSGGYITGNEAASGGGIRTDFGKNNRVTINGGFISGNIARTAEGGGVCIDNGSTSYITAGHITNNRILETQHWGGGGLFCANGAYMYIVDALITENAADGLGGGVAGCSTGRISITIQEGGAIYNNRASGTNFSGNSSTKNEDHAYAADNPHFLNYGFTDYYCALSSTVYGNMLGGSPAYWSGTVDGEPVSGVTWDLVSQSVMGLTAHPTATGIAAAQKAARVYINGNYSYTHGGGILSNGYLLIGITDHLETGARIELSGTKLFLSGSGQSKAIADGQFTFKVVDETNALVSTGTSKTDGSISFDRRLPFSEAGEYTYFIREVPGEDNSIQYDTTEYKMVVNVKKTELSPLIGIDQNNEQYNIERDRFDISSVVIFARNGTGDWEQVYSNANPGIHEDSALKIAIPGKGGAHTFSNYEADKISITAVKKWEEGSTTQPVVVYLKRNGETIKTVTLNSENQWKYTWTNLPTSANGVSYSYSVEEKHIDGYYTTYSSSNSGTGSQYWVPASSLEVGKQYIIVNSNGGQALKITEGHQNAAFTSDDRQSITRKSGTLNASGSSYSTWYEGDTIDARSIFTAEAATKGENQGIILKCNGASANTWLLVQNSNNNYLKGTSGSQYASFFTFNGTYLSGQDGYEWNPNNLRTVIYSNNKFNTSTTTSNAALLYTLVYGEITSSTTITITNTPVKNIKFSMDITKLSDKDHNLALAGAEFNLLDGNGHPLTFTGSNGIYNYSTSGDTTTVITVTRGKLSLKGLPAGTYTLHETKAPDGYSCVDTTVTLDETVPNATLKLTVYDPERVYEIPETGGTGTYLFKIGGLVLITGSLLCGCSLRRKAERRFRV